MRNPIRVVCNRAIAPVDVVTIDHDAERHVRALALAEVRAVLQKVSPESEIEDVYFSSFVMQ